jgi:hypothetical protein
MICDDNMGGNMSFQSENKKTNGTKTSRSQLLRLRSAPLLFVTLMLSSYGVTSAHATTLLDPNPESSSTQFGCSFAVVGDITGDGVPDLAVGARFQDGDFEVSNGFGPPQNVGKVWMINGATLGVLFELNDPEFQAPNATKFGGQFGTSVSRVGDINGDGKPEILVGVPHYSNFRAEHIVAGEAFVCSGADGSILFRLNDPDEEENNRMGFAVLGLGDVSGDGVPDLLVGVPKKDVSEDLADVGSAYIFSGADGSFIRSLDPPSQGGAEANGRFGTAVANAGNVNADGVPDILVGAPGQGRAYVFDGATGALIFTLDSPAIETLHSFGVAVAGDKDVDGDGIPDFAIGAPLQNSLKGAAYIFKGSNGKLLRKLRASPQKAFIKFGASVALTPDVTGDGTPDIMVGAPDQTVNNLRNAGKVYVFSGASGALSRTMTSAVPTAVAGFGSTVTTADFNGDGVLETVVGTPFQDANLMDPDGDKVTHLQIGQIEIQ